MKRHINTSNGKYTYTFVPIFLGYKQIDKAKAKEGKWSWRNPGRTGTMKEP